MLRLHLRTESTARAQQRQESPSLSRIEGPGHGTKIGKATDVFLFYAEKEGKKKRFPSREKRETVHQRYLTYFHSHATRIMRMGISPPVYRRAGFLTSSLFPRPRNRRVERFVKGGDRATRPTRNIPTLPTTVTKVLPLLSTVLGGKKRTS